MNTKKFDSSALMGWVEKIIIFAAHIVLLFWMLHTLKKSGGWTFETVLLHFVGMAIFGAVLISGSALVIKRRHLMELKNGKS